MRLELKTQSSVLSPQSSRLRPWQAHGLALLFFLFLTFWMLWPAVANAGRSVEGWGDALLQIWTLDWDAHALATNPLNLFNANAFYPYNNSLAFSETLIGQAVFVTPVIWLTDNPVLAFNLLLLASFVLSGWSMYLLVFELTGKRVAALGAGIIFAFFPHRFGQLSHLHLLATQWMPFCLLYLRRFLQDGRWRNVALFGLFFALETLSSTYLGLFLVVAVGLYLIFHAIVNLRKIIPPKNIGTDYQDTKTPRGFKITWRSWRLGGSILKNKIFRLAVVTLVVGLVVLPFYLPFLAVQNDLGFERSPAEVASFSALPYYYLDVAKENKLNQWFYNPSFSWNWWESGRGGERGLYLGLLASGLGLAGFGAVWRRRKLEKDGIFYAILAIIAVIFTFGPVWQSGRFGSIPLPYALLYNYVPGFQGLRVPVRFIYVVALAFAVLAGFALAALQNRLKLTNWRKASYLAVPLIALLCLEYVSDVNIKDSDALRGVPPPVNQWLAQHTPGPVLNVPLSGSDNTNLFYQYWSRVGWQPLMNGFSGFMPPAYDALRRAWAEEFPNRRLIELLQGLEVRYVVIDSASPEIAPTWERTHKTLSAQFAADMIQVAQFDKTFIYEVKSNSWLRGFSQWLKPEDPLYFVGYSRNDPQILELLAYYLPKSGVTKRENLFGTINIGFKQLPALPYGRKAEFLLLQAGEDPTLYGFRREDKLFGNTLLELYRSSPQLLARYDFSRSDPLGALKGQVQTIGLSDKLTFNGDGGNVSGNRHVRLAFAVTKPAKLDITPKDSPTQTLQLTAGFSVVELASVNSISLNSKGDKISLVWAELWDGVPANPGKVELRQDVVLVTASSKQDGTNGVVTINLVPKGGKGDAYTATLDIYNYPWGSHPSGHYGYWSVAVQGSAGVELEYQLDLPTKQMTTRLNGNSIPNYPPNPKDLDINSYGRVGDFRANLTLYAGDKLIGAVRLFDFTIRAEGDRSNVANRRLSDFKGYDTPIGFLVLPPKRN